MLRLDDHGTDRDHFVALMMQVKAINPDVYEVFRLQMWALIGKVKLDVTERAALVERFRALAPACPAMEQVAASMEAALAKVAAS